MSQSNKFVVAFHEAAHAVMAWSCGFPVFENRLLSLNEVWKGRNVLVPTSYILKANAADPPDKEYERRRILIDLAGYAAEIRMSKTGLLPADHVPEGHDDDFASSMDRLSRINEGGNRNQEAYICLSMFILERNWQIVDQAANLLQVRDVIPPSRMQSMHNQTRSVSEQDWAKLEDFRSACQANQQPT